MPYSPLLSCQLHNQNIQSTQNEQNNQVTRTLIELLLHKITRTLIYLLLHNHTRTLITLLLDKHTRTLIYPPHHQISLWCIHEHVLLFH